MDTVHNMILRPEHISGAYNVACEAHLCLHYDWIIPNMHGSTPRTAKLYHATNTCMSMLYCKCSSMKVLASSAW